MATLKQIIDERILILDGAMGTMIQKYNLSEQDFRGERFAQVAGQMKGNNDLLCLTRPDVIKDIHRKYLEAGADIIETNTFNAQRVSMADYHMQDMCREINLSAAGIAREMADEYSRKTPHKPRFVAGSVGPTNKTCSMSPDVNNPAMRALTYDELVGAYREQMEALLEGGVDALLIETIFDTLNAKAAVFAAESAMQAVGREVPLMLSVTVSDIAGRTLSGQTLDAFLASVQHAPVFSIGLNCSFGAKQLKPFLEGLAARAPYYISAYPNAGLPNSLGQYDQTPGDMASEVKEYIDEGLVNIIGGCCGTTEEYIAEYVPLVQKARPHIPAGKPERMWLSGLELLEQTPEINFINVGERCNVAGSRKFLRLINEKKYEEALSIARKQVEDGALIIDVNMDDGLLDAKEEMTVFLNLVMSEPDIARVPVMIDSSKWEVIEAGLKCLQGKSIVNSISLKEGEEKFIEHACLIKKLGAATVVMAFDEKGQADTFERKIEVCSRAYRILTEQVGFNPHDIIFDPNVLAVATGIEEHNNYAVDFIKATGWIKQNLPGAHVSGGVSNLSFSFRGNNYIREAMHAVFLYHAIRQGMDMGIVNPATSVLYTDIPADVLERIEDVVLNRRPDAAERLIETAEALKNTETGGKPAEQESDDVQFVGAYVTRQTQNGLKKEFIPATSPSWDKVDRTYTYEHPVEEPADIVLVFVKKPMVIYEANGGKQYTHGDNGTNAVSFAPQVSGDGSTTARGPYDSKEATPVKDGWRFDGWLLPQKNKVLPAVHTVSYDAESETFTFTANGETTELESVGATLIAQWKWRQRFVTASRVKGEDGTVSNDFLVNADCGSITVGKSNGSAVTTETEGAVTAEKADNADTEKGGDEA